MKYIVSNAGTGEDVKISYSDYGKGTPVVLIHGWPLSKHMFEYQVTELVNAGFRVVKYDRRGFGDSDKPWDSYDYDTLTGDLKALMDELDLQNAVLVGFSMGGGEAVRYLKKYGSERVAGIVLIGAITPFLLKTNDNPTGVDQSVFEEMAEKMKEDRISFLEDFGKKFFGVDMVRQPVSPALLNYYHMIGSMASPRATEQCAVAFSQTDFRKDVAAVTVPTLIIHGDSDRTVPIESSAEITAKMISGAQYKVYKGAPHGLFITHKEELNNDLIEFIHSVQVEEAESVGMNERK